MGIFSFLKKKPKEKETDKATAETLSFSDIGAWIEKKGKENEEKTKEVISHVKEKIDIFGNELRQKIIALNEFNIEEKKGKETERVKNIVSDSRIQYVESLEQLIERLKITKEESMRDFIDRINKVFFDFDKTSSKNYERVTILIGKEMANIKESLKTFSKSLVKTFDEGRPIITKSNALSKIKEKLEEIPPMNKDIEKINEEAEELGKKMKSEEEEQKDIKKKLEETKKSSDYLENLSTQRKIESLRDETKKELSELRNIIDFKSLVSFFHINLDQMRTVREHREDFQTNFQKDNGETITKRLDEAKQSTEKTQEKTKQIREKIQETLELEEKLKEDETKIIEKQINNMDLEIENLNTEKEKTLARYERSKEEKEELINSLKQKLKGMDVDITD